MGRWARQDAEWRVIGNEMAAAANGGAVSAYQVSLEQRKRMLARGERPMTYEEILADLEAEAEAAPNACTAAAAPCKAEHVVVSQRVFRSERGVGFRFEFCCREHSPTPFLEVEMTKEGSLRFAKDIADATVAPVTMTTGGSDG